MPVATPATERRLTDRPAGTPAIQTERLTKRYGGARGIENVTLIVRAGEILGFLGPNGAGKTTTIRLLMGLLHPSSGRARVLGHDVTSDGLAARAHSGYLPGDFTIEDKVSGAQLLDLLAGLRGVTDRRYATELADRFDADLHRPFGELSRGNRQKIGLIQALAHRPPVLILDEPTSGLDPLMQEAFVAVISEARAAGASVLLSSHNLAEVERLCDRVGVLREGRLVAVERVEDMRARALRHVRLQFADEAPATELAALPGVQSLRADGAHVRFTLAGELTPVLELAARQRVLDMEVVRPSLEEAFVTAYGAQEPR